VIEKMRRGMSMPGAIIAALVMLGPLCRAYAIVRPFIAILTSLRGAVTLSKSVLFAIESPE
jgi:hypothetical protein